MDETHLIVTGAVAPLEHDIEHMNVGDLHLVHWAVVWGLINRGLREGLLRCDEIALGWAESRFRAYGTYLEPAPTGHGLNALRRVTSGWPELPPSRAAKPTEGDYHSTLLYMDNVIGAYLDPAGPFYLGTGRWIPPALTP